jgi:pentatricopeptide repeat protein
MQSKLPFVRHHALRLFATVGRRYASASISPSCSSVSPRNSRIIRRRWSEAVAVDNRCCSTPVLVTGNSRRFISIIPSSTLGKTNNESNSTTSGAQIQNEPLLTNDQQNLLQYTQSLLRDVKETPAGELSHTQMSEMSSCIQQYTSGQHSYVGAEQVHALLLRLIMEQSAWQRYHFDSVIPYFNYAYSGSTFVDRMMSITTAFEEAYAEVPYKSIISLLCNCFSAHASTAAELILDRFETRLQDKTNPLYHSNPPTVETYNTILTSWAKSGRRRHVKSAFNVSYSHHPNAPSNLVSHMMNMYNKKPSVLERIRPDFLSFNTAIASLTREQHFRGNSSMNDTYHRTIGKVCFDHLQTMMVLYRQGHHNCAPDLITFSTVMMTLGRGEDRDDESRAMHILDEMLHLCGIDVDKVGEEGNGEGVVLNMAIFKQPRTFSELHEESDYDQINQQGSTQYVYNVIPRNKHFNVALALMAQSRKVSRHTLERARRYVDIMEQLGQYESQKFLDNPPLDEAVPPLDEELPDEGLEVDMSVISTSSSKPDTITYNTLLKIAAKAGEPMVADEIFLEMKKSTEENVKPDRVSFNTLLLAWSSTNRSNSGTRVTELLETMQERANNGDEDVRPDNVSMTTVINTLAKTAKKVRSNPVQAEAIIGRMEDNKDIALRPDVVTYTSLIKCWMESGSLRAASRAVEIIEKLHRRYEDGYLECKPDTLVYNVALNAIAKSKAEEGGAEHAEALLQRMQGRFMAGDKDVAPTAPSFVTVMNAWARSNNRNGGKYAEKLLHKMHELHRSGLDNVAPNAVAYSTCIFAWSKSGQRNAGKRAQNLLKEMERYHNEGMYDMKPNVFIYTNVMEAWIASKQQDSLEKVEAILEHMIEQSKAGDLDSTPSSATFNVVLKALRQSSHPEMHLKAEQVLDCMKRLGVKPNIITYNTFIGVCARTQGNQQTRRRAFSLVLNAFSEMQASGFRPDGYTWPAIWQACQCHLDVNTDLPKINSLFDLTVNSGAFNELLFNNIRGFLPPSYLQKKLNRKDDVNALTVHDLPATWTRNVKLGRVRDQVKKSDAKQ